MPPVAGLDQQPAVGRPELDVADRAERNRVRARAARPGRRGAPAPARTASSLRHPPRGLDAQRHAAASMASSASMTAGAGATVSVESTAEPPLICALGRLGILRCRALRVCAAVCAARSGALMPARVQFEVGLQRLRQSLLPRRRKRDLDRRVQPTVARLQRAVAARRQQPQLDHVGSGGEELTADELARRDRCARCRIDTRGHPAEALRPPRPRGLAAAAMRSAWLGRRGHRYGGACARLQLPGPGTETSSSTLPPLPGRAVALIVH